jgi:UDP-N-acetyl-2-amino-2-deoxyglucuronate dehydrogenase
VKELRAGVIGLGVGERHVASYRAIPGVDVVAVCDLDPARLAEVADRYDVPGRHTDYRGVTEDPGIDVVSICSYDDVHVEHAVSALRNGKHVMVEKPVALDDDEADRLVAAHAESGCLLTSNLILRASPRFRELRDAVARGDYGDVFYLEGDYVHQILWKLTEGWRGRMRTYSVVYGGGIHLIDLMRWILGQEVTEVSGMANKILTRDTAYRFHDTTVNLLRFEGGALAKTFTTLGPQRTKFHRLDVYGTRATFLNDVPSAKRFTGDRPEDEHEVTTPYPGMEKGDLLPELVDAIRTGGEPAVSATDVFRVMDVCFAAEASIREGRTVKVTYRS